MTTLTDYDLAALRAQRKHDTAFWLALLAVCGALLGALVGAQ